MSLNPVALAEEPDKQMQGKKPHTFMQHLQQRDNKLKKGMVFEVEDLRRDDCVVTCFKKVCTSNALLRMNCFVT